MLPHRQTLKSYHFIGIGGIGMSALARILLQRGIRVTGSDLSASYVTDKLKEKGAQIHVGHAARNVDGATHVVYNTQVAEENPEYREAVVRGLSLMHRSDLLSALMQDALPLLVAGTHGKTTTSSLLAHVLIKSGAEPSYAIGGVVHSLGSNGEHGKGKYFVAEACESDGTFLKYPHFAAIITNIDNDHLDYWKTEAKLLEGFKQFAEHKQHLVWCGDDPQLLSLKLPGISYGFSPGCALRITSFEQKGWKNSLSITFRGKEYREIEVPLIGKHNALNTAAVFGLCLCLDIPEKEIRTAFASFAGVGRRVEKKGEIGTFAVYDDYGHHPTEISTTLKAIKETQRGKRLVVAFQPHRFTRTRDCLEQFADVFDAAQELIVTDIYAALETPIEGITAEAVLERIQKKGQTSARYVPKHKLAAFLADFLLPDDILVTMGAGDITKVGPEVLTLLGARW